MKKGCLLLSSMIWGMVLSQVGIGTLTPDKSAVLDVVSKTKGVLLPRMTKNQRDLIKKPAKGLMLFCTDCNEGCFSINLGTTTVSDWYCLNIDSEIVLPEEVVSFFCEEAIFEGEFVEGVPFTGNVSIPVKSFFPTNVKITLESPRTSFSSLKVEPFQPLEFFDAHEKKSIQYTIKGKNDLVEGYYDITFKQYGNQCSSKLYVSSSKAKLDLENVIIDPIFAKESGALPSFSKSPDILVKIPYTEGIGIVDEKVEINKEHSSGVFRYSIRNPRLDFTYNPSGNLEYSIDVQSSSLPHTLVNENTHIYFPIYFENNKVYEAPLYILNNFTDDWRKSIVWEIKTEKKNIRNLKSGPYSFDVSVYNRGNRNEGRFNISIVDFDTGDLLVKIPDTTLASKKSFTKTIDLELKKELNAITIIINQLTRSSMSYSTGLFLNES
ncbi:hypothetical protein UJ101_00806 [Flavobacteriaceae bacterium UJ101]|nr:hypothetical protein UJ101_00806 [Flavobacteriaceae bacterium UJ101]